MTPKQRREGQWGGGDHHESRRLSSRRGGKPRGRRGGLCLLWLLGLLTVPTAILYAAAKTVLS